MAIQIETNGGQIKIDEKVLAVICSGALEDVQGVYSLDKAKNQKNRGKGVAFSMDGEEAVCTINLILNYGTPVLSFTETVQQKVHDAVESMTGVKVKNVNLNIVGLRVK